MYLLKRRNYIQKVNTFEITYQKGLLSRGVRMGYDGDIMLFSLDQYYGYMTNQLQVLHSVIEFMGDKVPKNIKLMTSETERLKFWKDELKLSPEVNEGKLYDLLISIKFYPPMMPTRHNSHQYHLWGWKTATLLRNLYLIFYLNILEELLSYGRK